MDKNESLRKIITAAKSTPWCLDVCTPSLTAPKRILAIYKKNYLDEEYKNCIYIAKNIPQENIVFPEEYAYVNAKSDGVYEQRVSYYTQRRR